MVRRPLRPDLVVDTYIEKLLEWFARRARASNGLLAGFSNKDLATVIGKTDLRRDGRAIGNVVSLIDFACYRLKLPPLGLTAEAPFPKAWGQQTRSWAFPISSMQRAARSFIWQDLHFDNLLEVTRTLPGQAHVAWRREVSRAEDDVRQWAHGLLAEHSAGETLAASTSTKHRSTFAQSEPPYWIFACNPAKWAIDVHMRGRDEDTWEIRPSDAPRFADGQLALIRVGVDRRTQRQLKGRSPLPAGIYALCEVLGGPAAGSTSGKPTWDDGKARSPGRQVVPIRYLRQYLDKPLTIEALRLLEPGVSPLLLKGFQAASFPISQVDFNAVLKLLDIDPDELPGSTAPPVTLGQLHELEARYADASPEVKSRVSKCIERGPVGAAAKKEAGYRCQLCAAMGRDPIAFRKRDGVPYVEAHHTMPVSKLQIGSLAASNIMILCANHHRQVHYGNAAVTITESAFLVDIDGTGHKIQKITAPSGAK